MKIIYLSFLALCSLHVNAAILDCDLQGKDRTIYQLVKPIAPFDSCKKAVDNEGNIVGYKLKKEGSYIDISFEDENFTHEDHFFVSGNKLTVKELLLSIYIPQGESENEYIKAQRKNLLKSTTSGIKYDKGGVYFFDLEIKNSAYKNYVAYIKEGKPNEFIGIGTDGSKELLIKIMFNKGMDDV
ncbi:hypothetical protein H5162_00095 [Pseudoalteromonas sp. SR41-8]|uniref:hypothetical protein n=1 Tax=Pseudoalteromonas sp. SR41-8 TaxID=2760946 RepID=UPI001603599C|nr:hypothetical protein [Pseudoalteromonas sp. SR41-8]MBB1307845.1 hypothetical protein [Pseudoalteromonas sp. SR41-8]